MLLKYDDIVYDTENDDYFQALIEEVLTDMADDTLVNLWNAFCDKSNYPEEHVYSMGELEDYLMMTDTSAYDVIVGDVVDFECFSCGEDYFIDSLYGLRSSNSLWDLVDFDGYPDFNDFIGELIKDRPWKYDCEEVEECEEDDGISILHYQL